MVKSSYLWLAGFVALLLCGQPFAEESNLLASSTTELILTAENARDAAPPLPEDVARIYNQAKVLLEKVLRNKTRTKNLDEEMLLAPERSEKLEAELEHEPSPQLGYPSPDTTLEFVEKLYSKAQEKLDTAEQKHTQATNHIRDQEQLTSELPDSMSASSAALDEARKERGTPLPEDIPAGLASAEQFRRKAAINAGEAELERFEMERTYVSSMGGILQSELNLAQKNLDLAKAEDQHWLEILKTKRQDKGFEWVKKTEKQLATFSGKEPLLISLCEENIALAKEASGSGGVIDRLRMANTNRAQTETQLSALTIDFDDNSLNFELRVWVNMENRLVTRDALNRAVDDAFRKAGIVIAFP